MHSSPTLPRRVGVTRAIPLLLTVLIGACASVEGAPSLAPRQAEAIDPRLPVPDRSADIPLDADLAQQLDSLVTRARAAAAEVEAAIARAEQAAAVAGSVRGDSWIAAQQALSAAVAARAPVARALGDLDALTAARLQARGALSNQDLSAIRAAAAVIAEIDQRQAARIDAVQARLGG